MSTDNQPKISESPIDINNTGPAAIYANEPAYVDLVLELHRTGLHIAESDGYITIIGRMCDMPQEYNDKSKEYFFPDISERFMSDTAGVSDTARIAITINVHRVLQYVDRTKFAGRLGCAAWHDYLVLSEIGPNGQVRNGTYHYVRLD